MAKSKTAYEEWMGLMRDIDIPASHIRGVSTTGDGFFDKLLRSIKQEQNDRKIKELEKKCERIERHVLLVLSLTPVAISLLMLWVLAVIATL